MRAQFVLQEIWIGLRRNLTMTVAVIVTVAISLALFGTGLLIRSQVNSIKGYWTDKVQVSVFLCVPSSANTRCRQNGTATQQQKAQIEATLKGLPQVQMVYYESQQQAYARFKQMYKSTPAFVQATRPQDIPDSFRVKLKNDNDTAAVVNAVQNLPGVDVARGEDQALARFLKMLNGLRDAALFIALIQVVAAALLIGNTIRLSAYNRRRETGIMRLVGASNLYIQLPFILEGAVAGLIGGLFASGLLALAKQLLFNRLQQHFALTSALGWDTVVQVSVVSVVTGVLFCALASFVTLLRFLRV